MGKFNALMDSSLLNVDSIDDIPEGTLFGIVAHVEETSIVYPYITHEGNFSMIMDNKLITHIYEKINSAKNLVSDEMLLMVKKIKGNLIQEVLSGEVLAFRGTDKDVYTFSKENFDTNDIGRNLSIEELQSRILKYSDACVEIESRLNDRYDAFFEITDEFKNIYSQETLSQRDEIVEFFKECKKYAKEYFKEKYIEFINIEHNIALTENVIYDLDNSDKPKTM